MFGVLMGKLTQKFCGLIDFNEGKNAMYELIKIKPLY